MAAAAVGDKETLNTFLSDNDSQRQELRRLVRKVNLGEPLKGLGLASKDLDRARIAATKGRWPFFEQLTPEEITKWPRPLVHFLSSQMSPIWALFAVKYPGFATRC